MNGYEHVEPVISQENNELAHTNFKYLKMGLVMVGNNSGHKTRYDGEHPSGEDIF